MYQKRYIAYAKAKNMTPDEVFEYDKETYPGGCMCGFILWICEKKRSFKKNNPDAIDGDIIRNNDLFNEYLLAKNKGGKRC